MCKEGSKEGGRNFVRSACKCKKRKAMGETKCTCKKKKEMKMEEIQSVQGYNGKTECKNASTVNLSFSLPCLVHLRRQWVYIDRHIQRGSNCEGEREWVREMKIITERFNKREVKVCR
jgi:hypothetical protein